MKAHRALHLALLAAALLILSGCKPAFDITLAEGVTSTADLAFVVSSREAPESRPEYTTVKLIDRDSQELLWHLRAAPFGKDASRADLLYGITPEGFEAVVEAPDPLPPGLYALVVSGVEAGQLTFRIDADGGVTATE